MTVPSEVTLDAHGRQVLALRDNGEPFRRYVPCSACGYLIGCGDAVDTIIHLSCVAQDDDVAEPLEPDHRCGEWCDHNRTKCDRLVHRDDGVTTVCGQPATWLAPVDHPAFPLAYCAEHSLT